MNGNGNGNGGPFWMKFVATFGLGSAIAVYLVWFVTTQITREEAAIKAAVESHNQVTIELGVAQAERVEGLETLLRYICSHTAETAEERRLCFLDD